LLFLYLYKHSHARSCQSLDNRHLFHLLYTPANWSFSHKECLVNFKIRNSGNNVLSRAGTVLHACTCPAPE
jgi:hypothetical protein